MGRSLQKESRCIPLDGMRNVIVHHQRLLWEIPSDGRILQRSLKSTLEEKETASSTYTIARLLEQNQTLPDS